MHGNTNVKWMIQCGKMWYSQTGHRRQNTAQVLCMLRNWGYRHLLRICKTYCFFFSTTTLATRTRLVATLCFHWLSGWNTLFYDDSTLELKCVGFCCITHTFPPHLSKDVTVYTRVMTPSQITFCLYHGSTDTPLKCDVLYRDNWSPSRDVTCTPYCNVIT